MQKIESLQNPRLREARSLQTRKGRRKAGKFLVEGLRSVESAVEKAYPIETLFVREDMLSILERKEWFSRYCSRSVLLSPRAFEEIADTVSSQGLIAVCPMRKENLRESEGDLVLILDRIQDPGNLGTLIRTADSAGISEVYCTKGTADIYSPKVVRSAMGSIFSMSFYEVESLHPLKEKGYHILASDLDTDRPYDQMTYRGKTALILGNEANGISEDLLCQADERVKIPIYGQAESLNVSIAGAILMYKLRELSEL